MCCETCTNKSPLYEASATNKKTLLSAGSDTLVRAEYARLEQAQSALAQYRERNFKVTLLTPNKSPSRHVAVGTAQQS